MEDKVRGRKGWNEDEVAWGGGGIVGMRIRIGDEEGG